MENKTIYKKLLEVQKEVVAIKKTEENPFFKSKYFDINGILSALKPVLNKKGLVLLQPLAEANGHLGLKTCLIDTESGETIEQVTVLPDTGDAQKQGSAITYFRRYALQSFFALEAVDDDGNFASEPTAKTVAYQPRKTFDKKPLSPEQYQGKEVGKQSAELDAGYTITDEDLR